MLFVLFVVLVNGVNLCKPAKLVDEEDLIFPLNELNDDELALNNRELLLLLFVGNNHSN